MQCSLWQTITILILVLTGVVWGQQPAAKPSSPSEAPRPAAQMPSKATVDAFMQHWFGYDPDIRWTVAQIVPAEVPGMSEVTLAVEKGGQRQSMVLYITADEKHAFTGEVIPFGADPFAPARKHLAASTSGIARGPANAALTIVEFSDLQCPHCKDAQPVVDKLLADFPSARFVFQQFPLEQLHPWAFKAATWAQCIGQENNQAFWKFVEGVYGDQLAIDVQNADAKMKEHATAAGADAAKAATCAANPQTAATVRQSLELGKAVGVTGTPTLFINGRKVAGITAMPYETLKSLAKFGEDPASK